MTQQEATNRNIGLTFDFVNYLLDNPNDLERLPDNFALEFREKDFPTPECPQATPSAAPQKLARKYVQVKNTFEFA
ncbi:MAG: hypothetical protein LBS63_02065 [Prevotellaceae bacterium]|jgi:hypothetical protein|nr:hypothetical protein [Prevotellaceae bacterium]